MAKRFKLFSTACSFNILFVFIVFDATSLPCFSFNITFEFVRWKCYFNYFLQFNSIFWCLVTCKSYANDPSKLINSPLGQANRMFNSPVEQCVYECIYGNFSLNINIFLALFLVALVVSCTSLL